MIWDTVVLGVTLLPLLAIIAIILVLLWIAVRPAFINTMTQYGTPQGVQAIKNVGDGFFFYTIGTLCVFFYFMMILACFINARYQGADHSTLAIGLIFLVIGLIVSFPISDFLHALYTAQGLQAADVYLSSLMYLVDNMPVITALSTIVYLALVITNKNVSVSLGGGAPPPLSG